MKRLLKRLPRAALFAALLWLVLLAVQIVRTGRTIWRPTADVAIVLGAAADGARPSPVFEERIKHGIALYKARQVACLIFTGGSSDGAEPAESAVARRYAFRHGVPPGAILIETRSHTTRQNLLEARRLMAARNATTALIVSDPLHLKRALRIAADLGIDAHPAPTPTSRYRSWHAKSGFLLRELWFYHQYLVTGQ